MDKSAKAAFYAAARAEMARYAKILGLDDERLPGFDDPFQEANVSLESDGTIYLEYRDRSNVLRQPAVDIDDLCFRFFKAFVTHQPGQTPDGTPEEMMRGRFANEERLMAKLNPEWALRLKNEHYWDLRRWGYER